MAAKITELITARDTSEIIRDEIAAILLLESENQETLATAASEDPREWALRIFLERSNPWGEFEAAPDQIDATPIVNVSLDNVSYAMAASNVVERQHATGIFHIDCYGYGISTASNDDYEDGHEPGDEMAALEAQRAVRLVRKILMAGAYTYLGMRGTVGRRWPQQVQFFQPTTDGKAAPHIVGARLSLQVEFNELSPQFAGQLIELISATVKRRETGEIYFAAQYELEDS